MVANQVYFTVELHIFIKHQNMRIIIVYNDDLDNVITKFGTQNQELYSEEAIRKMEATFQNNGFEVKLVDGNLDMFENLRQLIKSDDKIPFVFNRSYGIQGENRYSHIPSIFEMLGLPYFGSGPFGHTLALDKIISKELMRINNIPTPEFWQLRKPEDLDQDIQYPVIVKPTMEAGSFGMQVVNNKQELRDAFEKQKADFKQIIFAERFISGREFVMGLIGNGDALECFPLLEINLDEGPESIQTSHGKINDPKEKFAPDDIPEHTINKIKADAKKLFRLLRLRDYARIDFRMDNQGNFYFLEINSMASLGIHASFVHNAKIAGYNYDQLILKLFEIAVSKYFGENQKLKVRYESILEENRR